VHLAILRLGLFLFLLVQLGSTWSGP